MFRLKIVATLMFLLGVLGVPAVSAAPIPDLTLDIPSAPLLGEPFSFTATFQNTGADAGYGPFIDLVLPASGADGDDGVTFVDALYLGVPLQATVQTLPADTGCVGHPFARDIENNRLQVCGTPGDQLVTLRLPFGSFVPSQLPAEIDVTAAVSPLADVGVGLNIRARAGFEFGADPLRNPCCDPVVVFPIEADISTWGGGAITPGLVGASKTNSAEDRGTETAVGSSFVHQYTIAMNIPDGETINNFAVRDDLANTLAFVSLDDVLVNGVSTGAFTSTLPPAGTPQNAPNNRLSVTLDNPVTGTSAEDDVVVVFSYFVAEVDANGTPTLDPTSAIAREIENTVTAVGNWTPGDPRDDAFAGELPCPVCGAAPLHALWARAMAVQKGSDVFIDSGATGPTPGDILQNTIDFQLADTFTADLLIVEDIFTDGLAFYTGVPACTPSFSITDQTGTVSGTFTVGNDLTITTPFGVQGETQLLFDVALALTNQGDDGSVIGGDVAPGGIGATGTITYCTEILEDFLTYYPSGDSSVDLGDVLSNEADMRGQLQGVGQPSPIPVTTLDDAGADVEITRGTPAKVIYAVNGVICGACLDQTVNPDDTVTYRLTYELPTSDFDNLTLTDFLPIPIFDAAEVTTFDPSGIADGTIPGVGNAKLGPADTFYAVAAYTPTIVTDGVNNTVSFDYGNYDNPTNPSTTIDILFTVSVTTRPFADGLLLVNQLVANETNTVNETAQAAAVTSVELLQPFLQVRKGVIGTDNPASQLEPALPIAFADPGDGGDPWNGIINSQLLDGTDINSDIFNADNGDLIRFAIVIENVGHSDDGAFDIIVRDVLQAGFAIPPEGINLQVRRGDGTVMSYTGSELDLFNGGIELVDPNAGEGVCQTYDLTSGANIVILTYDLQVETGTDAFGTLTNSAGVTQYASQDGLGAVNNFVDDRQVYADGADVNGDAPAPAVNIFDPAISKIGFLLPGELGLAEEQVEWIITISNPSGVTGYDVAITDTLRPELRLDSVEISKGEASINGQTISVVIPVLEPGEVVTMNVFTTVLVGADRIGEIENTVCALARDMVSETCSTGQVIANLPETGEPRE